MEKVLNTQADVKNIIAILLNQVIDKENYDLKVEGEVHFEECEPTEEGYVMGSFQFIPWGADAFQVMQTFFEQTVADDYISVALTIHNLQEPVTGIPDHGSIPVTEDNVREFFNKSFAGLDEAKSAGSMYVGDNGAYILEYLDVSEGESIGIVALWQQSFGKNGFTSSTSLGGLQIHIC